jgi:hypothetical protein
MVSAGGRLQADILSRRAVSHYHLSLYLTIIYVDIRLALEVLL